jgi:hypothetical protein
MPVHVDTQVLAFADSLIKEFDLISIKRPFPVSRPDLRIALGAAVKKYCDEKSSTTTSLAPDTKQTILQLVEEVNGRSAIVENPTGANYCFYCSASGPGSYPDLDHTEDCPKKLASKLSGLELP